MLAALPFLLGLAGLAAAAPSRTLRSDLSLSKRATLPAGWSYSACMQDASTRLLQGSSSSSGSMTVESCIASCVAGGYSIAGLENSVECYCSGAYTGTKTTLSASTCSSKCAASSDTCGGNWALSVYTYTAPTSSSPTSLGCFVDSSARILSSYSYTSSSMTSASCITTCAGKGYAYAGVEYGVECYCGSSFDTTKNIAPASDCSMACQGGGGTCGGSYRMNAYATSATKTIAGWAYQYCASDGNSRALTGYTTTSNSMTLESCLNACSSGGYAYGGVEYANQCFCGNSLSNGQGGQIAESVCNMACAGDSTEKSCGGSWAISLYKATTTAPSPSSSSPAAAPTATLPSGWALKGCYVDQNSRTLGNQLSTSSAMTPAVCVAGAVSAGFAYAGVENGGECWMGNSINGNAAASGDCSAKCAGDSSQTCGGSWRVQIYANSKAPIPTTTATATTTTPPAATTTSNGAYPTQVVPPSGSQKYVWAHHLIGNTYPYDQNAWVADIQLAQANGIDGFALNIGTDGWQPDRVAKAYAAASQLGNSFKMFLSFDMTVMECGSSNNLGLLQNYVNTYYNHAAAAKYNGKSILSTFAGQDCSFSQGSTNNGWNAVMNGKRDSIYWMPTFTSAPTGLNQYSIDGEVNWGSAWPTGGSDIETSRDQYFMSLLGSKGYIGTVSPLFFSHFGYKNFMWRGDDWLYAMRWEQLISMRSQIDQVEIASWNDYGESTYVGPIEGDMPPEAKVWATSSFPHSDILSLQAFYSTAWKTGQYPKIAKDTAWVMARPHRAGSSATSDGLGPPTGTSFSQDNFYAQVHLTAAASVILSTNSGSQTFSGQAGINRFSYPLAVGSNIRVQVVRNGQTTVDLSPAGFSFVDRPAQYNFNYIIKSSG